MKIVSATLHTQVSLRVDEGGGEVNSYYRDGPHNWSMLYGESVETVFEDDALEEAYALWVLQNGEPT